MVKQLLYLIIIFITLNIILEIFLSGTKLDKFIRFVFSAVVVFFILNATIGFLTAKSSIGEIIQENNESIEYNWQTQTEELEKIIVTRLRLEFDENVKLKLAYHIDENTIVYDKITIYNVKNANKVEDITKVINEYVDCEVVVVDE